MFELEAQKVVICHPSLFTAMEVDLYEQQILANPRATEHDASRFFDRYPKFLLLGIGRQLRREVVLIDSGSGNRRRVDFFRRSFGRSDWDIVELKSPRTDFLSAAEGEHPRPSPAVVKALHQAEDYRDWIIEDTALRADLLRRGISVYRPQILLVAGREGAMPDPKALARVSDRLRRGPVEAISYDAILRFAKEHYIADKAVVLWCSIGSSRHEMAPDVLLAKRVDSLLCREFPPATTVLPFSGRGVKWKIRRIDNYSGILDLTLFARRPLEQHILMGAFSEVLKAGFPELDVWFSFDETSPLDLFSRRKTRRELDGD